MQLTICDNCGCSIDEGEVVYNLLLSASKPEALKGRLTQFELCKCCADNLIEIMTANHNGFHNVHAVNCGDILPLEYRCPHSSVANPDHSC